jgi:AraC-like DNA-binding protein
VTYKEVAPHPALSPYVDRLWYSATDVGAPPLRVLPDGCMDVIVDLDAGGARAIGTMTRAVVVLPHGPSRSVAVRFRPGAAVHFLRVDAGELTDENVELAALGARWFPALPDTDDLASAARHLERSLLGHLRAVRAPDPVLAHAVARLSSAVPPTIAALGRETGWSRQHLSRRFRADVGVSPKQLARVARLQRAMVALQRSPRAPLAAAAVELGFFDQPHLARELRDLAGITPLAAASASEGSIRPIASLYADP